MIDGQKVSSNSLFVLFIRYPLSDWHAREKQNDECCENWRKYRHVFDAFDDVQWNDEHSPPQNNFAWKHSNFTTKQFESWAIFWGTYRNS